MGQRGAGCLLASCVWRWQEQESGLPCLPLAPCLVNHAAFPSVGLMCKLRCKATVSRVLPPTGFFLSSRGFILPSVASFYLCSVLLIRLRLGLFEFHLSVCDSLKEVFVKAV